MCPGIRESEAVDPRAGGSATSGSVPPAPRHVPRGVGLPHQGEGQGRHHQEGEGEGVSEVPWPVRAAVSAAPLCQAAGMSRHPLDFDHLANMTY